MDSRQARQVFYANSTSGTTRPFAAQELGIVFDSLFYIDAYIKVREKHHPEDIERKKKERNLPDITWLFLPGEATRHSLRVSVSKDI